MKRIIIGSGILVSSLFIGVSAYACDMHGAGFSGFGLQNADWKPYNPRASYTDPAFGEENFTPYSEAEQRAPTPKRPSFSNAAKKASSQAQKRLAEKEGGKKPSVKAAEKVIIPLSDL